MTIRCQKAESKKPAIWGALKLTKKFRECRSLQLRRHVVSGRKVLRLDPNTPSSSPPSRPPSFSAQSSEIASLHSGFFGSHLTPLILYAVRQSPYSTKPCRVKTYRQGIHPVCILFRGISSTLSSVSVDTWVPLGDSGGVTPNPGATFLRCTCMSILLSCRTISPSTGVTTSSHALFRPLGACICGGGGVRHCKSTPLYQLLLLRSFSRTWFPAAMTRSRHSLSEVFKETRIASAAESAAAVRSSISIRKLSVGCWPVRDHQKACRSTGTTCSTLRYPSSTVCSRRRYSASWLVE